MGGLFTELGPFVTSDLSFPNGPNTGPYTVQLNNYTCEQQLSPGRVLHGHRVYIRIAAVATGS